VPRKAETARSKDENSNPAIMWVEKYKPAEMKKIVGQSGNASCANKLQAWLKDWQKHQGGPKEKRPKAKFAGARGAIDPTGHTFRAALLSGPPGIGKTTTAHLVARSLGFELIEFNASDTRSKKSLASVVKGVIENPAIDQTLKNAEKKVVSGKYVAIMDEVDGMAGNEDRGGIAELIGLVKVSKIPIICICNDRQHPKIRSLANHVFDLRFMKPRVEQITGKTFSKFANFSKVQFRCHDDDLLQGKIQDCASCCTRSHKKLQSRCAPNYQHFKYDGC
jgi:replication factor C subunit 1